MNIFNFKFSDNISFTSKEHQDVESADSKLSQLIVKHGLPLLNAKESKELEATLFHKGYKSAALLVAKRQIQESKAARLFSSVFSIATGRSNPTGRSKVEQNFKDLLKSQNSQKTQILKFIKEHPSLTYELINKEPDIYFNLLKKEKDPEILTKIEKLFSKEKLLILQASEPELMATFTTSSSNLAKKTLSTESDEVMKVADLIKTIQSSRKSLKELLSEGVISNHDPQFLLKLAPHFKYVDLRDLDQNFATSEFLEQFIQNCPNLTHLFINSDKIKKLPAELALCTHLNCRNCSLLTELPELPNCTTLHCSGCSQLTKLPLLPNCTYLNCSNCSQLTKLSAFPNCTYLNCSNCSQLTALPELSCCTILNCSGCLQLAKLPQLPCCTTLNCPNCSLLTELSQLPCCAYLNCSSCSQLTALPELSCCTILSCSSCSQLTELPQLPLCTYLNCSSCSQLTALPALPSCTILHCVDCSLLTTLLELPLCTCLNCPGCLQLTTLPKELPSCTSLYLNNCLQLNALPALPLCTQLDCSNCSQLTALPALPLCTHLDCRNCSLLAALPVLPCCIKLNCSSCSQLTVLPELPYCTELYCSDCSQLNALPALPCCIKLQCSRCSQLRALPALPLCTHLYCPSCSQLTTLPALPLCTHLYCPSCSQLTTLPAFPLCTFLDCSDCERLTGIPEVSRGATIYSSLSSERLDINLEDLNSRPQRVLDLLTGWFGRNSHFPNIQFLEKGKPSDGVDVGGLRRHLVSTLFNKFVSQDPSSTDSLLLFRDEKGAFPLQPHNNDKMEVRLKTIGQLFAFACRDGLLVGRHFDSRLFSALSANFKATPSENAYLEIFYGLSGYSFIKKGLNGEKLTEQEKDKYQYFLEQLKEVDPNFSSKEALEGKIDSKHIAELIVSAITTGFLSKEEGSLPYPAMIAAVQSIAEGIKSIPAVTLPENSEGLQLAIEGVLTKDSILESLNLEGFSRDAQSPSLLKNWIQNASQEDLTSFVKAVTGSTSLIPGKTQLKITYDRYHPNGLPVAHTCFYHLELPEHDSPQKQPGKSELFPTLQESFDFSMKMFLTHSLEGTGFSLA